MKKFQRLHLVIAIILLGSCGSNNQSVIVSDSFNSEIITSNRNKLQNILTKQMIAKVMDIAENKIEVHIENNIYQKGQYTVSYSWPTGKKKKVGGGKFEIDEYNSISIGFVKQTNFSDFEKQYGSKEGLQMQVDAMAKQADFNKEIGTAEAKYIADYAKTRRVEKLENIATAAFWEAPMNALHILAKDVAFTLTTNWGDDEKLAKQKAIEILNAIINP